MSLRDERRRRLLAALALLPLAAAARAHTPYRQWVVYRRRHLLIGTTRADAEGYRLGKELAATLLARLPESRARVARARDARRLASLMATGQLQTAFLNTTEALVMSAGEGPYREHGALDLRLLLPLGHRVLVAVAELPDHHAWLVTGTLSEAGFGAETTSASLDLRWHWGSLRYLDGAEMPEPPAEVEAP